VRATAIALVMLAGCAPVVQRVPAHTHERAELGLSCAETCAPWGCDSSYDIAAQAEISCEAEAKRYALCICRAP
jgi:hypothetical protein